MGQTGCDARSCGIWETCTPTFSVLFLPLFCELEITRPFTHKAFLLHAAPRSRSGAGPARRPPVSAPRGQALFASQGRPDGAAPGPRSPSQARRHGRRTRPWRLRTRLLPLPRAARPPEARGPVQRGPSTPRPARPTQLPRAAR